ncbi:ubiquitin fusion degradation 1 [Tubulinosema ratisbonensis]|uniref:Ubiquitin fusion degradation 1 n=1 Tax=Tubulinosema ratisbonensis TaxID=291195 RepID=A0A437ANM2_9MICR|nr:ubiquitin fusion degradation 1 [Tubulinosema ratisbonensis]
MFFNIFNSNRSNEWFWSLVPLQYNNEDKRNYTGKIILPMSVLEDLVIQNIQPPYIFEITNKDIGISTYCGVLEFTGEESLVLVPNWLHDQLNLENTTEVIVKYRRVVNGSFARLLPHSVDFLELEAPKFELEKCLREYQVLSPNDEILLYFDEKGPLRFTVKEVHPPAKAVYIVDVDLKVDFLPPIGYEEKIQAEKSVLPFLEVKETNEEFKEISMKELGVFYDFNNLK